MGFSKQLARTGFAHRATLLCDDRVVYRLADGSGHVALPGCEWRDLGAWFAEQMRPVARRVTWMSLALFPAIFVFGVTIAGFLPGGGILILGGIFLGPVAIYLWQSAKAQAISRTIEAELARLPRVPAPPKDPSRAPRWLEIAFMLTVGPGLIVQAYGSLNPDAFRDTPWKGSHLDWKAGAALAILAAMLVYGRRRRPAGLEPLCPDRVSRRLDAFSRARQE